MMAAVVPEHHHRVTYAVDLEQEEPPSLAAKPASTHHFKESDCLELVLVGHTRTTKDTKVYIRLADLHAREEEMQQAAEQFQISKDRWEGSLLFRQYYENGLRKLRLDPERDCIERNYSYAMQWEDWLTTLLVQYYETGRLNIPDACQGSDLLLLLEYFGILYAPDQLVFASYAAYQRVRAWSDYLTQRAVLADHVVHLLSLVPSRTVRVYQLGTVETPAEKLTLLPQRGDALPPIYSWGCDVKDLLSQSHLQPQSLPPSSVIYNLFNMTKENKVAEALRDDFSVYLQNLVPLNASDVTFSVKMVQVQPGPGAEPYRGKRAVLKLTIDPAPTLESSPRTKSELTHPMDEVPTNQILPEVLDGGRTTRKSGKGKPPLAPGRGAGTADHVYRDLDGLASPSSEKNTPSKLAQQRSIDPVMAGKPEAFNAPIDIVDPIDSATITSALTGPFNGGDTTMGDEDVRAEALRQEWVQGSLLNRDIDHRMKELLEGDMKGHQRRPPPIAEEENSTRSKPYEPGTPETTPSVASEPNSPANEDPPVDKGCTPWEWVNMMCNFYDHSPSPTRNVPIRETKPPAEAPHETPRQAPAETPRQAQVVVRSLTPPLKETETTPKQPVEPAVRSSKAAHEVPAPEPKISTHEGVKHRLAELRKMHEQENHAVVRGEKPGKESNKAVERAPKKADAPERSTSPSKVPAFFRSRQSKAGKTTKKPEPPAKKGSGADKPTVATKKSVPTTGSKKAGTTVAKKASDAKRTPSPKKMSGSDTKKAVASATKKASANTAPPKKSTGLMKLFRRGNE